MGCSPWSHKRVRHNCLNNNSDNDFMFTLLCLAHGKSNIGSGRTVGKGNMNNLSSKSEEDMGFYGH